MPCCGTSSKDNNLSHCSSIEHMKLQQAEQSREASVHGDDDAAASCGSPASAALVTAANTMPQVPAESVRMAGYLDKRGKRLPTWKRYWFVLDGRLLLYFRSQFDYLQLSPCRGSLNLGLVSGVRPAGSRSSPQLELLTRSQTMLLRAKERGAQERWLQALLDAMQLHPHSGGSTFRYTNASLPQSSSKKNAPQSSDVTEDDDEKTHIDDDDEDDDGVATPRVLQRIKHIGGQSHATLVAEIRSIGTGSLRHVSAPTSNHPVKSSSMKVSELSAQLPTNKAVLRLLERRQQEEEDQHVTTIIIDPTDNETKEEIVNESKESVADIKTEENEDHLSLDAVSNLGSSKNSLRETMDQKSKPEEEIEIENDAYVASKVTVQEDDDGLYEAVPVVPVIEDEEVDYDTMGPIDDIIYEPSVPPRRVQELKSEGKKKEKESTVLFVPSSANIVKRKRSFLQRMLGKKKNKKLNHPNIASMPEIRVESADNNDDEDDYETVDYEELMRARQEQDKVTLLNQDAITELQKKIQNRSNTSSLTPKQGTGEHNLAYVNVDKMLTTPATTSKGDDKIKIEVKAESKKVINEVVCNTEPIQETKSNIVPIVENEKTHTVIITVHNNGEVPHPTPNEDPVVVEKSPETSIPQLPPRQNSSGNINTTLPRPTSPWHDVPTNNAPVIAKSKRRSSDLIYTAMPVDLVLDIENEDCEKHTTIINIAADDQQAEKNVVIESEVIEKKNIETKVTEDTNENKADINKQEPCESCVFRSLNDNNNEACTDDEKLIIAQICDHRCTHKHQSADELDILLLQLTQITNSPLTSASVDALGPLRRRRQGSDPDYDIPRPHQLYMTLLRSETKKEEKENDETMEATRFFNEPDLYYARPLSEYLQELDNMSNVQQLRKARANKAFYKWIEDSQGMLPSIGFLNNNDEDVKKILEPKKKIDENTDMISTVDGTRNTEEITESINSNFSGSIEEVDSEEKEKTSQEHKNKSETLEQNNNMLHDIGETTDTKIESNNSIFEEMFEAQPKEISIELLQEKLIEQDKSKNLDEEKHIFILEDIHEVESTESSTDFVTEEQEAGEAESEEKLQQETLQEVDKVEDVVTESELTMETAHPPEIALVNEQLSTLESFVEESIIVESITTGSGPENYDASVEDNAASNRNSETGEAAETQTGPLIAELVEIDTQETARNDDELLEGENQVDSFVNMITASADSMDNNVETSSCNENNNALFDSLIKLDGNDDENKENKETKESAENAKIFEEINFQIASEVSLETSCQSGEDRLDAIGYLPLSLEPLPGPPVPAAEACSSGDEEKKSVIPRRVNKKTDKAVRLSFAMAEAEIVVAETVNTIKTPFSSTLFSFPPSDQGPPDSTL